MPATVVIAVPTLNWTEIPESAGYITNEGNSTLRFKEAEVMPNLIGSDGHSLYPGGDKVYSVEPPYKLYVRAINSLGQIALTPIVTKGKK